MIFPILNEKKKQYTDMLKGQLVFMPVYLLLLYAAMTIITKSTVFNDTATSSLNGTVATGAWIPKDLIVLAINDFFIIFLLNLPLVTAFSMAGSSVQWLNGAMKKFGAENVWQNVGKWSGNQAGRRLIGGSAYALNESGAMKKLNAASPLLGGFASNQIGKVANAGFGVKKGGYKDVLEAKKKSQRKTYDAIGNIDRSKYATEAEYQVARDAAGKLQREYAGNLEWTGIMGHIMDNRANRQSRFEMGDPAKLVENKKQYETNAATGKVLSDRKAAGKMLTREEENLLKHIEKENAALDKEIKAAETRTSKAKQKGDVTELIKKLKESEEGGGSKEGGDKPKTT
jgi:hypothetical protein